MKKYQENITSIWISLIIGTLLSMYLILRRGYFDLYIANKIIGTVALILLGLVMMIGPLTRIYHVFTGWLKYRKQLGIVAFFYAAAHGFISYFVLTDHFPKSRFTLTNLPFIFGLASTILLVILFLYSFSFIINTIERKKWWKLQNWGMRLALIAAFLHIVIMKYPGWLQWIAEGGSRDLVRPYLPPASLLGGIFGVVVLTVRLADSTPKAFARYLIPSCLGVMLSVVVGLFILGYRQTPQALPLDWESCTALPSSMIEDKYPPTCISVDGRRVTFPLYAPPLESSAPPQEQSIYYGSSTLASCAQETDCVISGCNSEICQGKKENVRYTICVVPDKLTPLELKYTCSCQNFRCLWTQ